MAPFFILLAQVAGKMQQEEEQKREKLAQIAKQRAAALGGNTMGIEAEEFKRAQGMQNFGTAKQLFDIYDRSGSKPRQPQPYTDQLEYQGIPDDRIRNAGFDRYGLDLPF